MMANGDRNGTEERRRPHAAALRHRRRPRRRQRRADDVGDRRCGSAARSRTSSQARARAATRSSSARTRACPATCSRRALAAGICSMGVDVLLVGPLPTPGIAFLTPQHARRRRRRHLRVAQSVPGQRHQVLRARRLQAARRASRREIERLVLDDAIDAPAARPADEIGKAFRIDDARGRYIVVRQEHASRAQLTLDGLRVVVDCANGAAYRVAPEVFEELGAKVIAHRRQARRREHQPRLRRAASRQRSRAAVARARRAHRHRARRRRRPRHPRRRARRRGRRRRSDGDARRASCCATGALAKQTRGRDRDGNLGLELRAARASAATLVRTQVGDRYVVEEMRAAATTSAASSPATSSSSITRRPATAWSRRWRCSAIMVETRAGRCPSWRRVMRGCPQVLVNVRGARAPRPRRSSRPCSARSPESSAASAARGRVLVRYSGTEPLVARDGRGRATRRRSRRTPRRSPRRMRALGARATPRRAGAACRARRQHRPRRDRPPGARRRLSRSGRGGARGASAGGADGITVHLREDRRHIQDRDVERAARRAAAPSSTSRWRRPRRWCAIALPRHARRRLPRARAPRRS